MTKSRDLADNSQNTKPKVVDAKGDLIVGTGADAADRLAVGANGFTLVADSSTSTGLAYGSTALANPVINGGFDIWQRGTSISLAASTAYTSGFSADRWQTATGANQATTISRQSVNDSTNLPNIQYCLRFQRNSGQTGTATYDFYQSFETANSVPFAGKTITLSFYARAGANYSATSSILDTRMYTGTGTDQNIFVGYTGSSNIIQQNATLTTTWQRFSYSATLSSSTNEIAVGFRFAPTGTAGTNDYFEVTGVQIDLGSTALPFRRSGGTIQGELAACQRYYIRLNDSTNSLFANGNARNTTNTSFLCNLPVSMRTRPTSVDYTSLQISDGVTNYAVTSITSGIGNQSQQYLDAGVASGLTQFRPMFLQQNGSTGYVAFSAEL